MSKFEMGVLKYLQFYNLTCNDCGGWRSNRCLNGTSCTLPVTNCTCPDSAPSSAPSSSPAPAADANAGAAADEAAAADAGVAAEEGTASVASDTSDGSGLGDGSGDAAASGDAGDGSGDAAGGDDGAPARRRRVLQDSTAGACNYTQFTHCAATVNLAFEGLDVGAAAFSTASQVRKLNSYSLVALFAKGKALFFDFVRARARKPTSTTAPCSSTGGSLGSCSRTWRTRTLETQRRVGSPETAAASDRGGGGGGAGATRCDSC
ncbi:MAG: hypothetical protein J3K34DRAFT_29019 [Monoraphidium minutum]|nr:MAG: hypothetical protein J3K34DRAFT_29019 [Monoraphidium minutum]